VIALWVGIALHELAHLLAGLSLGFWFYMFVAGFLGIPRNPRSDRVEGYWNRDAGLFGGLRLYLWFGRDGIIRKKQEEKQQITARILNLLTNIVLVWNIVYIQAILKQLRQEGYLVDENDFEHISSAPLNILTD
jgi:hypothetical protein